MGASLIPDMKKLIIVPLLAGLFSISSSTLLAQTLTNATPNTGQLAPNSRGATKNTDDAKKKGAPRREVMAILGFTRADFKGLTPENRAAKLKDAANKKIAELESKQTAGSLTEKEQTDLALLKKFEHHGHAKAKTAS